MGWVLTSLQRYSRCILQPSDFLRLSSKEKGDFRSHHSAVCRTICSSHHSNIPDIINAFSICDDIIYKVSMLVSRWIYLFVNF